MAATRLRRICFITGTRAEYGLMRSTLEAIRAHPRLKLQILATGAHLSRQHGRTIDEMRREGFAPDATARWDLTDSSPAATARATGRAITSIAKSLSKLDPDIVLVVGDRVEAFAGAVAGCLSGRIVAHVHGGDRAMGQVDDSLRHAITKLAHVHFPATDQSAARIRKLGEQAWRIRPVGAPGIDGLRQSAMPRGELIRRIPLAAGEFALLVLHPAGPDDQLERRRARLVLRSIRAAGFERIVIIQPNSDPGSAGIRAAWDDSDIAGETFDNVCRDVYLGLMREAAVMVGNSSSGIIEAASFSTPVVDIGPRQQGRQRSGNTAHVGYDSTRLTALLRRVRLARHRGRIINVYGGAGAGAKIARALAALDLTDRLRRKLIAY